MAEERQHPKEGTRPPTESAKQDEAEWKISSIPYFREDEEVPPQFVYPPDNDWTYRPWSPSEWFTEAGTEEHLLDASLEARTNPAAVIGLVFALMAPLMAALLSSDWGLVFSGAAFLVAGFGAWRALRGAQWLGLAVAGMIVPLLYVAGYLLTR